MTSNIVTSNKRAQRRGASAQIPRAPINRARGEAALVVGDETYKLAVTMAALAEIEDGLGIESLDEIETVLTKASTTKLAIIIAALARGGGHADVTPAMVRAWPIRMSAATEAMRAAFEANLMADEAPAQSAEGPSPGN